MSPHFAGYFALGADVLHVAAMLIWGLGFPLLFWHRWPRLSVAYTVYALVFVLISWVSQLLLGECILTTLARFGWQGAGSPAMGSFIARVVNYVAGIRPTEQSVVIAWEVGIVLTAIGSLWSMRRTLRRWAEHKRNAPAPESPKSGDTLADNC